MKSDFSRYILSKPVLTIGLLLYLMLTGFGESFAANPVKKLQYQLVSVRNHYPDSYTQGLFFADGSLYESNGQYGRSSFQKLDPVTGEVLQRLDYPSEYFVEGSCVFGDMFYVLTWMENVCFVYDRYTMTEAGRFYNPHQGWGITTDGESLIMSDGGTSLYFLDPMTFEERASVEVTYEGKPLSLLNELEYIDGKIWANVYMQDYVVVIDPMTGVVEGRLDLGPLRTYVDSPSADALNGIAYEKSSGRILLTGKLWGKIFEIKLK